MVFIESRRYMMENKNRGIVRVLMVLLEVTLFMNIAECKKPNYSFINKGKLRLSFNLRWQDASLARLIPIQANVSLRFISDILVDDNQVIKNNPSLLLCFSLIFRVPF